MELAILVVIDQWTARREIRDICAGGAVEIHITLYAAQTPEILTFEICSGAPAVHLKRNRILPFGQKIGDIPFRCRLGILIAADILAVDPCVIERDRTLDAEDNSTALPSGRHRECAAVRTDFIALGRHQRRIFLKPGPLGIKLIGRVDVDRRAVTLTLPVARHIDLIP